MAVICVLIPRFALIAACEGRRELLREPVALAPEPGGRQAVGEVSGAAEAHGVRAGMRLGEALSRCPELGLMPADPGRAADLWEETLRRLEGIGAWVESERSGEAFFEAGGLRGIHGGTAGTMAVARRAGGMPARVAAAPTRFASYAAALTSRAAVAGPRARRAGAIVPSGELPAFLSPLPVSLLAPRLGDERAATELVEALERLGIGELGALAALGPDAVADRFGPLGLRARRLARGEEDPPRPRKRHEGIAESIELPEAAAGPQLERALGLLVDRLLASPLRRGRTVRSLRLAARLAGGGSWRRNVPLRRPSASGEILRLALAPRLAALPGPAVSMSLRVTALGPSGGDQLELSRRPEELRRRRRGEAVRQVRAATGAGSLLRVLDVDGASRVPERWTMLTPFPES
jgi:protein ImuB